MTNVEVALQSIVGPALSSALIVVSEQLINLNAVMSC